MSGGEASSRRRCAARPGRAAAGGPRALALAALASAALGLPAPALGAVPPTVTRLALPGEVVASAELPGGRVALATATPDGEVALWRLEMASDGPRLRQVQAALGDLLGTKGDAAPPAARVVAMAPAPGVDGSGDVLLSVPGALWRVGEAGPRRVPVERGFALVAGAGGEPRLARATPEGPLALARAGELLLLDPASGAELARVRLPAEARQRRWGLELRSPPVRRLSRAVGGTVVVVGPQKVGERRLRTLLVDATGAVSEAWSLLPAGGRFLTSRLLDVDGHLVLAATTAPDGMLAKQRLHLFRLEPDRTRRGGGPLFGIDLDVRHWFEPEVAARDLDGDGRAELLIVEPRGLGGRELTVTAVSPAGGGRFTLPARRVKVGDDSGRWSYEGDVDGDGLPDLLQLVEGRLAMHRGQRDARGGAVAARPEWSMELGGGPETRTVEVGVAVGSGAEGATSSSDGGTRDREDRTDRAARRYRGGSGDDGEEEGEGGDGAGERGFGPSRLAVADLDGDGRGEVLLWRTRDEGGSELTVLWQRR